MNDVSGRIIGFATSLGRFARDGAAGFIRAAQQRAAEKRSRHDAEQDALAVAVAKAKVLAARVVETYEPRISQADVDAVSWQTPDAVEELLVAECDRIRKRIEPVLYEAGYPLGAKDYDLRKQMMEAFSDLLRPMHAKAFGDLRLPPFFALREGLIEFEPTIWSSPEVSVYTPAVGVVSGYLYTGRYAGKRPSLGFL